MNAYRYENGRMVWQDALSRTTMSTGVAALSDIDADPVIEGNFGHLAPVIGGASIPLLVKYSNDKEMLFKD